MQQLFFILLLTRPRDEAESVTEEFRRWLAKADLPAESARKKVFERRIEMLNELLKRSRFKLFLLVAVLQSMRYVQLSAETTNWQQPQAYIIEDLLAVETPAKKLREIHTVLLTKNPEEVREIVEKFRSVFSDRFQQSSSGYSYYTDEEKLIMEKRLRRFEALAKRPAWKAKLNGLIFSTIKLFLGPIKRLQASEQK